MDCLCDLHEPLLQKACRSYKTVHAPSLHTVRTDMLSYATLFRQCLGSQVVSCMMHGHDMNTLQILLLVRHSCLGGHGQTWRGQCKDPLPLLSLYYTSIFMFASTLLG